MIAEWNVVFEIAAGLPVHCLAFGYDPETGVYVVVDPHHAWTEVTTYSPTAFDLWIMEAAHGNEVYRTPARRQTPPWFPGLWCVGAVKRLVGLRSSALSPAGLRRDLVRSGARRVFSHEGQG